MSNKSNIPSIHLLQKRGLRLCTAPSKAFKENPSFLGPSSTHMGEDSNQQRTVKRSNTILKRYPGYNPCSSTSQEEYIQEPGSASTEKTATYHHNELYEEKLSYQTHSTAEGQALEESATAQFNMGGDNIPFKRSQTIQLRIPITGISRAKVTLHSTVEDLLRFLGSFTGSDINFCVDIGSHTHMIFFNVFGVDILNRDKTLFCVMVPFVLIGFLKTLYNQQNLKTKYGLHGLYQASNAEIKYRRSFNEFKFATELFFFLSLLRTIFIFKSEFANRDSKFDNFTIVSLGALLVGCLIVLSQETTPNMIFTQKLQDVYDSKARKTGQLPHKNYFQGLNKEGINSNDSSATLTEADFVADLDKQKFSHEW